ncbi:hypothetical protein [Sulfurimonas sp.]
MKQEEIVEAIVIAQGAIKAQDEANGVITTNVNELIEYREDIIAEVVDFMRENELLREEA